MDGIKALTTYQAIRRVSATLSPVSLMRLTETDDPDELLKKYPRNQLVVEHKLDGWKLQAIKQDDKVHFYSRRGQEVTNNFPDIAKDLESLPNGTLVEGELVYWHDGKQDIGKMTSLANSSSEKSRKMAKELPGHVKLHLYDILWKGGKDISSQPFFERRKALQGVVKKSDKVELTEQKPFSSWQEAMKKAVDAGGEGIVIKLKSSDYDWKPKGQNEPKPSDKMWKYKGGAGKSDSDDYVVYAWEEGEKGKLKALFGQYYKGKLYHISEISNFSKDNEKEIKERLKKGPFVIEIGFQERVPKGLRHQKFLRFRDDKKPKDATMNEFHAEHLDELKPAKASEVKDRMLSRRASSAETIVRTLERLLGIRDTVTPESGASLKPVPGIDIRKAYHVISGLESGRKFAVGDSGTSFGTVQVQFGSFVNGLANDPQVMRVTGMSPSALRSLASAWRRSARQMRKIDLWKNVPVDEAAVRETMKKRRKVVRRREGVTVRHFPGGQPGVVKIRRGRMIGRVLNLDSLRRVGLDVDDPSIKAQLYRICAQYITDAVVRNGIAKLLTKEKRPRTYAKFRSMFTSRNVNSKQDLRSLADRVAMRNFSRRVRAVMDAIRKSGYDTTKPGAFNAYQLVGIANASGLGRLRQFLFRKKTFGPGHLAYLERANPALTKAGIPSRMPPKGGLAGFPNLHVAQRKAFMLGLLSLAEEQVSPNPHTGTAGAIRNMVERFLGQEEIEREEWEKSPVSRIVMYRDPPKLLVQVASWVPFKETLPLLPTEVRGMPVEYLPPVKKVAPTPSAPVSPPPDWPAFREKRKTRELFDARIAPLLFGRYHYLLGQYRDLLKKVESYMKERDIEVPEDEVKRTVGLFLAERHPEVYKELQLSPVQLAQKLEESARLSTTASLAPKTAAWMRPGTMAFPGSFAEDIKSGKKRVTIRPGDMPVRPEEVVEAITYSGSPIARIRIISKETMSLKRIEKAFGKRCAQSLERRFGANRRFVVIRFERFDANEADDGTDEKKMSEVLIDGKKTLTRGDIVKHYSKPSVRKSIMSRIKGNPVLVYIGTGKNQKILKRNHDGKPIVITSDDEGGKDSPSNYWYWVKRRVLSFHEVFGKKTNIGFVDLDLHGGYPLERAKEYAAKLVLAIKKEFDAKASVYQSGGTGLHVEFQLPEEQSIDKLRKQLKKMLGELNEDFEGATTGIVKGKGMRTDISTLHNRGSLRVPGSLGESQGMVKKKISVQATDDDYGNNNYGDKHGTEGGPEASGREGAFALRPPSTLAPDGGGGWNAAKDKPRWWISDGDAVAAFSSRRDLFRRVAEGNG